MTTTAWIIGSIIAIISTVLIVDFLFRRNDAENDCKKLNNRINEIESEHKRNMRDVNSKLERIYNIVKK